MKCINQTWHHWKKLQVREEKACGMLRPIAEAPALSGGHGNCTRPAPAHNPPDSRLCGPAGHVWRPGRVDGGGRGVGCTHEGHGMCRLPDVDVQVGRRGVWRLAVTRCLESAWMGMGHCGCVCVWWGGGGGERTLACLWSGGRRRLPVSVHASPPAARLRELEPARHWPPVPPNPKQLASPVLTGVWTWQSTCSRGGGSRRARRLR